MPTSLAEVVKMAAAKARIPVTERWLLIRRCNPVASLAGQGQWWQACTGDLDGKVKCQIRQIRWVVLYVKLFWVRFSSQHQRSFERQCGVRQRTPWKKTFQVHYCITLLCRHANIPARWDAFWTLCKGTSFSLCWHSLLSKPKLLWCEQANQSRRMALGVARTQEGSSILAGKQLRFKSNDYILQLPKGLGNFAYRCSFCQFEGKPLCIVLCLWKLLDLHLGETWELCPLSPICKSQCTSV